MTLSLLMSSGEDLPRATSFYRWFLRPDSSSMSGDAGAFPIHGDDAKRSRPEYPSSLRIGPAKHNYVYQLSSLAHYKIAVFGEEVPQS